jgi:hypothetical protein
MQRSLSPWTSLVAGAMALLFAPDCTRPAGPDETEETGTAALDETDGVVITAAVWTLAWDDAGVSYPAGGGFDVETDLGYRVHVQEAWILSHSVSLGRCDPASVSAEEGTSEQAWWQALPIRTAHAHVEDTDPSTIETSWIEDLTEPHDIEVSTSFAAARYCRAHWLLARATEPTTGAEGVSMENRSLVLKGTFERDGEAVPFAIDTWWPHGALLDLPATMDPIDHEAARRDGAPRHAFVTVTRHLGRMFDGIDFEAASQDQIDGTVIDHLTGDADIDVVLWAPGEGQ